MNKRINFIKNLGVCSYLQRNPRENGTKDFSSSQENIVLGIKTQYTAKNTVISPNFLAWKFCGEA